ncbi:protein virilizer [Condylostylus longicornis]|uniref:protein virilizer n=1 Tax=Condylostylus longicornis TaxID=2530218 RepID=UPI00244E0C34|nr:protein virilizer [Condylostylus longicornis]
MDLSPELLFFDTFSHEANEDINLDLVQFPKPVYITEVRIIPLGARVQADFPGGVRLGATNPSKFDIEFFVNDLGKPGASTFEILGSLEYNQNNCIHLECPDDKIPTDGLVLRGWYSTITLAVYGTLTKNLAEQIASPQHTPSEPTQEIIEETPAEPIIPAASIEVKPIPLELQEPSFEEPPCAEPREPREPVRSFSGGPNEETFFDSPSRELCLNNSNRIEHEKRSRTYSDSNDREYNSSNTSKKREWSRSPEYRHSRRRSDRSRRDSDTRGSSGDHKRPRTPPQLIDSPPSAHRVQSPDDNCDADEIFDRQKLREKSREKLSPESQALSEANPDEPLEVRSLDGDEISEQFEPILSDDEILGDDNSAGQDDDMDIDESEFDNPVKVFDPFKMPINVFECNLKETCASKIQSIKKVIDKFQNQEKLEIREFVRQSADEKETFVNLCELLINNLMQINQLSSKQRNFVIHNAFQDESVLKLMGKILRISLNFECACSQMQPGYKIRHIKIGPRLVELTLFSQHVLKFIIEKEFLDPYKYLFDLYHQDHMALSIKLIILKAIYSVLDSKYGVQNFLSNKANGYQKILLIMQNNPLTRLKFALKAIVKKINLFEALETIRDLVTKHFVLTNHISNGLEDFQILDACLQEVTHALNDSALSFQQPKRFLPSNKFEFHKDQSAMRSWSYMLQCYFREHALSESLLLIITNQNYISPNVLTTALNLLSEMVKCQVGIDYLVDYSFETTELLIKCLLGLEDEYPAIDEVSQNEKIDVDSVISPQIQESENSTAQEPMETEDSGKSEEGKGEENTETPKAVEPLEPVKEKSPEILLPIRLTHIQKLGVEIAFKVQTRYHIDAITNNPTNVDILCEHLHALYSQTCSHYGRVHTTEVLGFSGTNLIPFLNLIEKERKIQAKRQLDSPGAKYKSPVLSYSVDLLDVFVRNCANLDYLIDHGQILLDFVKNHDVFEPSVSAVLQEMAVYLKPLELIDNFSYGGDINALSDLIKRSIEYITTFPGDLIMVLRILKHLTLGNVRDSFGETKELKLKYVLLQFYSADGVVTFLNILEKLNNYFEQPGLHGPTLMTIQGVHTCQVLLPVVQILREMLTFVIECRDTSFKDVTAIEHLMKTYFLMHYFPERSQAYDDAQKIRAEIIKIFLAYTQPNEDEHIRGSLWTQMIREVLKCIRSGPSTFIPGLQVLAELLPLPLPVSVLKALTEEETQRLIMNRNLWSAHLHPESANLSELIQTLCPTTFPQLSDLLTRVCLQLADLAPNMTLLVSKTICDMIVAEFMVNCTDGVGSAHLARLLNFMAQLTCYAAVKISALSIFPGKVSEAFLALLNKSDKRDSHLLCQTTIHRIFENFFDSEISMFNTNNALNSNLDTNLANALPSKELIPDIANAVMMSLLNSDPENSVSALRNLIILTEHDITFYHLRQILMNKKADLNQWMMNFISSFENSSDKMSSAITFVLFLRNLVIIDEPTLELSVPSRTLKLAYSELKVLVCSLELVPEENPLNKLKVIFESKNLEEEINEFENVIQDLKDLIEKLEDANQIDRSEQLSSPCEPNLQHAEGIVTQFLSRQIFTVCENVDDVQLNSNYWLEPLRLDEIPEVSDSDRVHCNLGEVISTCLPPETNLSSDCKRILHLSASPQSNRERTATAPCFRTRRVEVEPQTGRPEKKKIYISPMRARGFPRAPPSRGDLFRSRPPNTSRPPSLHVDDFLALETCGAQPTGPTGYNKLSRDIIGIRGVRGGRNRGRLGIGAYRKIGAYPRGNYTNVVVVTAPPPQHFRTATSEPVVTQHFPNDQHPHFSAVPIRSRGRGRIRTFLR